jgi:hypothetical protein
MSVFQLFVTKALSRNRVCSKRLGTSEHSTFKGLGRRESSHVVPRSNTPFRGLERNMEQSRRTPRKSYEL